MKAYLAIIVLALLLLGGAFAFYKVATTPQAPTQTNIGTNTGLGSVPPPSGGTTATGITITNINGVSTKVNDFIHNPATVTSAAYPNHYFLAGGLNPSQTSAPYSTFYVDTDQSFNITLLVEPISKTRLAAEQALMKELGLTQDDMCRLRYTVSVPNFVDTTYSGKNLGFSFCPGATQLP